MGYTSKLLNIQHSAPRIAYRLPEEGLCVWPERLLYFLLCGIRIHEGNINPEFLHCHAKEIERSPVNLIRRHDMIARLTDIEDGIKVGSLSTGCQNGADTSLQLSYL